jgi:hypothetical protein
MSASTAFPAKSSTTERAPRGQSFIEAMVAITVIVTSISSSLALVQSSITATHNGGIQVTAANLAREGAEVVRGLRDTNWLKSQSFQVGLVDASGDKTARPLLDQAGGGWSLSFAPTGLTAANAAVYVTGDGVYLQADAQPAGSTLSPYTRVITLQHICRDDTTGTERTVGDATTCLGSETLVGLNVDSTVRWRGVSGQYQTLTVEERLYDWR